MSYPIIWPQNPIIFQTDDPVWADLDNTKFPGIFNNFLDAIDGSYCDPSEEELDPPYPNPAPGGYKGQKQCGVYKPTNVISISYGFAEFELPIRYNRRQCYEWMKLGLQGVSVVAASGNNGVATGGCLGKDRNVFTPGYLICPYITTVGGTYFPPGGDPYNPLEVAVDHTITPENWSSGGGFSNIYERPTYQASAVEEYFSRANLDYPYYESINNDSFAANDGIYNRIGRAYPDISAVAVNNFVFWRGGPILGGGTSASAPIFAAILTRINEERLAAGMPTVGFVNPMLYAHPEAFRDITEGNNPGCSTDGFTALEGWDPVTGLGTPIYPKLLEVFMSVKFDL
jgi:tripeptidyl-peptidase-1